MKNVFILLQLDRNSEGVPSTSVYDEEGKALRWAQGLCQTYGWTLESRKDAVTGGLLRAEMRRPNQSLAATLYEHPVK